VTLKVPYQNPSNAPIRLVTAQQNGTWQTVDHIPVANGFATTTTTHFSYYALITGDGPEPPPLPEGGADAETDAGEMDATTTDVEVIDSSTGMDSSPPVEAAAPAQPTLFATSYNSGAAYRFQITPSVIIPPEAGTDEPPSVNFGNLTADVVYQAPDGGLVPAAVAMGNNDGGAPYTLYVGAVNPADRTNSQVVTFSDPFGTPTPSGSFAANTPVGMAYGNELWLSSGTGPAYVVTVDGSGNIDWGGSGPITTDGPFSLLTVDTVHQIVYVGVGIVQAWPYTGSGAGKDAGPAYTVMGNWEVPGTMAIAPWGDLLVLDQMNIIWDNPSDGGLSNSIDLPFASPDGGVLGTPSCFAMVHWPSGVDEIFVALQTGGLYRYVLDATHNEVGASDVLQPGIVFTQLLIAP